MQQLETTIAALAKRGDELSAKRVAAHDALDKAIKARQEGLLSGDLDDQRALDMLQAAVDTATSALVGIDDAVSVLAQQKAEAEAQLAAERERIERAAAAEKLAAKIGAIEAALPKYLAQSRIFTDALSEIGGHHFESTQMAQFVQNAAAQVELASNIVLVELRAMPERIKTGDAPIPRRPQDDPEPIAPVEPPPLTQVAWMLRTAKFRNYAGVVQYARQYEDCELPLHTAQRALRRDVAVPVTDPRRRDLKGARGGFHPDSRAPDIVDLDDDEAARRPNVASVIGDPRFIVLDRSAEARTLEITVPPAVTMKATPPGLQPHQIVSRIDGWVGGEDRIPAFVAEMIARAMPPLGDGSVTKIKARMYARQRMVERMLRLRHEQ